MTRNLRPGHTASACFASLFPFRCFAWPSGTVDLGHFGISNLEVMILFEQLAGHRLLIEKVFRPRIRAPPCFPFLLCLYQKELKSGKDASFVSRLVRSLSKLPGGIGRFLPCSFGGHMSTLRHLGWDQCSHGLTSGPLESCLQTICGVLGYPKGAAA